MAEKSGLQRKRSRPKPSLEAQERHRRARELAERSGIPLRLAFPIVDGHTTLDSVLKNMLARARAKQLVEEYGLSPSVAGQVARGHVPLEKVLRRMERRNSSFWRKKFSIFDELLQQTQPVAILCFGRGWLEGRIPSAERYEFTFESNGRQESILKHDLKLLLPSALDRTAVARMLEVDPEICALGLGATENLDERLALDKEEFYEAIREGAAVRFVFRDGDRLIGPVLWFARYEFAIPLESGGEAVGFFHALYSWMPVKPKDDVASGMTDKEATVEMKQRKKSKKRLKKAANQKKKQGR